MLWFPSLNVFLSVLLPRLFVELSVYQSVSFSVLLSHLYVELSVYQSVCLAVSVLVGLLSALLFDLYVCLSVCLSFYFCSVYNRSCAVTFCSVRQEMAFIISPLKRFKN